MILTGSQVDAHQAERDGKRLVYVVSTHDFIRDAHGLPAL